MRKLESMRKLEAIVRLIVAAGLATSACVGPMDMKDQETGGGDGKADGFNVKWDKNIPHIVPKTVHNFLESHGWGNYHLYFHMTRRWFILGDQGRKWLSGLGEQYANLQEGDQGSGIEFLTMHRAMIQYLRETVGNVPVTNDPQYKTFSDVLDGWKTDDDVVAAMERNHVGGQDVFRGALGRVNDPASFQSEDEFGLFLQTRLRLSTNVDPNDSFQRFYDQASEPAGIHNTLHGLFSDPNSPIDVGNPQTNLSNELFWGIHGWIEAKWQQFERAHVRTTEERETYDQQLERFLLHMQLHSDHAPKAPSDLAQSVGPRLMSDVVRCADLDPSTQMPSCEP